MSVRVGFLYFFTTLGAGLVGTDGGTMGCTRATADPGAGVTAAVVDITGKNRYYVPFSPFVLDVFN